MELKTCSRCGTEKLINEFSLRMSTKKGLVARAWCIACERPAPVKTAKTKQLSNRAQTIRRYGITPEEVEAMGIAQEWKCALCATDIRATYKIDHDHLTGKVRKLLCFHCNVGLGHFKDSPELLQKAIAYLNSSELV